MLETLVTFILALACMAASFFWLGRKQGRSDKRENVFFVATIEIRGMTKDFPLSRTRAVGWFPTFKLANEVVVNNYGDIHETSYKYAIIEEFPYGLYPQAAKETWYEFNELKGGYVPIEKPAIFKNIVNFAVG